MKKLTIIANFNFQVKLENEVDDDVWSDASFEMKKQYLKDRVLEYIDDNVSELIDNTAIEVEHHN